MKLKRKYSLLAQAVGLYKRELGPGEVNRMSPRSVIKQQQRWFCATDISDSNRNERQPSAEIRTWTRANCQRLSSGSATCEQEKPEHAKLPEPQFLSL